MCFYIWDFKITKLNVILKLDACEFYYIFLNVEIL